MILEAIIDLIKSLLYLIFDILPDLPSMPDTLVNSINYVLDIIFNNSVSILSLFVRINTFKIAVPVVIALMNLDKIYSLVMWVIKKIPLSVD